jgi:hypothetical protein
MRLAVSIPARRAAWISWSQQPGASWMRIQTQKLLYRYFSIYRKQIGLQVFDLFSAIMDGAVLPIRHPDVSLARKLSEEETHAHLSPRDFVHLAVMLNNDISCIVTADQGLARVPGIKIIYPR